MPLFEKCPLGKRHAVKSQDHFGKANQPTVEALLQYAEAALQNGYTPDVERIARDVLSRSHNHPRALELLGLALLEQGRPAEAVKPIERRLRHRRDAVSETYLALAYRALGRSDESMTLLQRATERRPAFPPAFLELGKLLWFQHRLAEAETVLKCGMEAAPGLPQFAYALGNVLLERGDMEGAKQAFTKALAIAPGFTQALHGLVQSLKDSGDFQAAVERAREACARDPSDTTSHILLATCLLELGKSEEATEKLRSLVGASPKLLGMAVRAFTEVGHGRLWLKPSAAAESLGLKRQDQTSA